MSSAALIALDWGTTRARAFRIDATGRVLDTRSGDLGVQRLSGATFPQALAQLTGDWSDERAPRLACGMIGSRQGWREAPYLPCPASLEALSRGLVEVEGAALAIVPGLSTRDGSGLPDVMRGEETQIFGAVPIDAPRTLVVLPGSHSKWARVERGVVLDFTTYLTGELYDALVGHTILGRLATPAREGTPGPAFLRGVERGLGSGQTLHDIFGARTLALSGELEPDAIRDWLSGLLIGREVRAGRVWAQLAGDDAARVLVVGSDALAERYLTALAAADVAAERGPAEAAATGLYRIARAAGRLAPEHR
ncbi:MAG: 2-dehydro-3-deoxygalactonokinase [Betaproteobacteria bacterium PRO3]|nr:2-dehydro-3-deoxygalactonokinase [Betaproteobacteria bacterium PRO3]